MSGSSRPSAKRPPWPARHPRVVALAIGLVVGFAVGWYVHAWWGSGMFVTPAFISAIALVAIGLVAVAALVSAARAAGRGQGDLADTSAVLAVSLLGGVLLGATLGPGYRGVQNFAGRMSIEIVVPSPTAWAGEVICVIDENASEVSRVWGWHWAVPGGPIDPRVSLVGSGPPALGIGSELDSYDSYLQPVASVEVRQLGDARLAGVVAFSGLRSRGDGLLVDFPGQPIDGTVSWTCDPTRPAR